MIKAFENLLLDLLSAQGGLQSHRVGACPGAAIQSMQLQSRILEPSSVRLHFAQSAVHFSHPSHSCADPMSLQFLLRRDSVSNAGSSFSNLFEQLMLQTPGGAQHFCAANSLFSPCSRMDL